MTTQDKADARELAAKEWAALVAFHDDRLEALERAGGTLARHAAWFLHLGEHPLAARHAAAYVLLADIYRRVLDARIAASLRRAASLT